jgi:hypothetical protein
MYLLFAVKGDASRSGTGLVWFPLFFCVMRWTLEEREVASSRHN